MADTARRNRLTHPWHDLEPDDRAPEEFYGSLADIPLGSKTKYKLDKLTSLIKLNRVLGSARDYPTNFIPQTLEKNGEPLSILVLCQGTLTAFTSVHVRTMGFDDHDGLRCAGTPRRLPSQRKIRSLLRTKEPRKHLRTMGCSSSFSRDTSNRDARLSQ